MTSDDLDRYREKRDFASTPEPDPDERSASLRRSSGSAGSGRFVIQEHDASTHHWDFRLEVEGVLRSWAVPKGPSTDPSEKRLAVPTEDHPLEYADFEGVIPEGEYGAGAVIIWDEGTYESLETDGEGGTVPLADQLDEGHAKFALRGEKLLGGYLLQRISTDDEERWLLIKLDDDDADARRNPTRTQRESVRSDRTVEEVTEEEAAKREEEEGGGE